MLDIRARDLLELALDQARAGSAGHRSILRVRLRRMPMVIDALRELYDLPGDTGKNEVIRCFLEPE
ncbi:MAG: hypothetical protein AAF089_15575 [Bacteroidota bacterium]